MGSLADGRRVMAPPTSSGSCAGSGPDCLTAIAARSSGMGTAATVPSMMTVPAAMAFSRAHRIQLSADASASSR